MTDSSKPCRVLICGGGNAAHVLAGLASSRPGTEVRVLSLFQDEAERWSKHIEENDFVIEVCNTDGTTSKVKSKPSVITKDVGIAATGCDVVVITVPAFAHEGYLVAIAPYIQPNCIIAGLPSQAGFEFQCFDVLKDKAKQCAIVSFETLPWACRLLEFGKGAQILGTKETVGASVISGMSELSEPPLSTMQFLLGEKPVIKEAHNYIEINLMQKSMVHPPLMYGVWGDWDGKPLDHKPLFYQGVDKKQADLLSRVSDEIMDTANEITKKRPDVSLADVIHIFDWYKQYYCDQITDNSSLMKAMNTNKAYDGLVHPMTETDDGKFVPNFKYRYMAEDVPYGLVVFKGIAEIAGVKTPVMDEIIIWSQKILGKEYLIGSELKGKDLNSTRAPQRYGFMTMDDLFKLK